jgi:hypothetical protein
LKCGYKYNDKKVFIWRMHLQTDTQARERAMSRDLSWAELAELTHATQVEHFSFCLCEDNEGQENPYADCPKGDENE